MPLKVQFDAVLSIKHYEDMTPLHAFEKSKSFPTLPSVLPVKIWRLPAAPPDGFLYQQHPHKRLLLLQLPSSFLDNPRHIHGTMYRMLCHTCDSLRPAL